MGALPVQSLALALCSTLAVASRIGSGLTQTALARRDSAGLEANAGEHSVSWSDKPWGEDGHGAGTLCVGLLAEVKTKGDNVKLFVLGEPFDFHEKDECEKRCFLHCHINLKHRIEPWQAKVIGFGSSGSMVATHCSELGKCSCLDAATTTERVKEYTSGEQELVNIIETEEMDFRQKAGRCTECSYLGGEERGLLNICVDKWNWHLALYSLYVDGVGFKSQYVQQFKIEAEEDGTRQIYLVGLAGSEHGECPVKELGLELTESVKLHVVEFSTSFVKVGPDDWGGMRQWDVRQANSEGRPWMWELLEEGTKEVSYTIKQQGAEWMVYQRVDALARGGNAGLHITVGAEVASLDGGNNRGGHIIFRQRADSELNYPAKTPCACFLKEVATEHGKFKLAVLQMGRSFKSDEECHRWCPWTCHKDLKNKFNEGEWEGNSVLGGSRAASQCDFAHRCLCLDAEAGRKGMEEYRAKEPEHLDTLAKPHRVYDDAETCLQRCQLGCWDKAASYEGLCMHQWDWTAAVYDNYKECRYERDLVGLVSCHYAQQFRLEEALNQPDDLATRAYTAYLDKIEDGSGHELKKNLMLYVARFEAGASKWNVTVNHWKWTLQKTSVAGLPWNWEVFLHPPDEVVKGKTKAYPTYTIKQQSLPSIKGIVWKVYLGKKRNRKHLYYAYEGVDAGSGEEEGFNFRFYRDEHKKSYAGCVLRKGNAKRYKVEVQAGDHAGTLLIMSMLIGKAHDTLLQ